MENASKALIMAGSILVSLLIIGALIYMFGGLSKLQQIEGNADDVSKLQKYDQLIEGYCKPGLYGSELLSLANLIQDYNKRQSDIKGYTPVKLEMYTKKISAAKYFKESYNNHLDLIKDFNEIESEVNTLKREVICGESIEKISGMRTIAIQNLVDNYNKTSSKKYTVEEVEEKKDNYLIIKSEYITFKNKRFDSPTVELDKNNGRIMKLTFYENGL